MSTTGLKWGMALWALANVAAAQTPAMRMRAETEERARREVNDLFGTLCPEQCVLLGVSAAVDEEPVGSGAPGFEGLSGAASLPVLKAVEVQVLLDQALPSAFRTRVKGLASQRLTPLGVEPTVTVQSVTFPPRNAPHLEAKDKGEPLPKPEPTPPPEVKPPLGERLVETLIPAAPLLAVIALLVLAVLGVAAVVALAIRRANPAQDPVLWEEPAPVGAEAAPAAEKLEVFPELRLRRMERVLTENRTVRNAVVRDALARGDAAKVALWIREFGPTLLDDVRAEGTGVDALAAALGSPASSDPKARVQALHELEGRVLAATLLDGGDPAARAFAFLEGVPKDRFAAACRALAPAAAEVALRYANADQRAAYVRGLPAPQQAELALAWARKPEVSARYAASVAEELRAHVADTAGGATQSERLLREIMGSLPRAEQDHVAERLAGESNGQRLLLTESTLARAPQEVLASALLQLPPARLVTYLSGTEDTLRERLLQACPANLKAELREELGGRPRAGGPEYQAARTALLDELQREIGRRGLQPEEVAGWRELTNGHATEGVA